MTTRIFEHERAVFEAHRHGWVAADREGWWVAIRGDEIVGPFPRPEQAWDGAVEEFGKPGFFMRQVTREDRPLVATQVNFPDAPKSA